MPLLFSTEQLNFFKFATIVFGEFPPALRLVFVFMWDNLYATTPGIPKWDDSVVVRNDLIKNEGGVKKVPTLNQSYEEWDCTGLFRATLFAQTFAKPSTLDKLYVKPRGLSPGKFHPSVISPTRNTAETYALALDQLRLLRNTLCHQSSTQMIDKGAFDNYILLAKEAFTALGQDTIRIYEIGKLGEEDFPTARRQQLEDELKREKDAAITSKQIYDHLNKIKSQVEEVILDVRYLKAGERDTKRKGEAFKSDLNELKTNLQAMQAENLKGPNSCIPDKIPHFVGRQDECRAILNHGNTRLINVWGPPGFGKTSVVINVAHQLREMKIPVYFASLRGMTRKDDIVPKLLSIYANQAFYLKSPSDWLIRCLQQQENPFVLILDNADDLLESGDAKLKADVLRFIEEILAQCNHINLLIATRESLEYLSHKVPIHQKRVGVLDEVSSSHLVKSLLPDVSDEDCSSILKACGQVPLVMRLMCSTVTEEHVSVGELIEELKVSPLLKILDDESFSDDDRPMVIFKTCFERLAARERDALVSLNVFPDSFGVKEAKAVANFESDQETRKMLRLLKRKSLIDCIDDIESCTIHSLFRSFIEEKRKTDQVIGAVFNAAQRRFHEYNLSWLEEANERYLTGHSNEALTAFLRRRVSIIASLINGAKEWLYDKVVEVLAKAQLFLYTVLGDEERLFNMIYDSAVEEAERRGNVVDKQNLLAAKSFGQWCWFSSEHPTWDHSLQAGFRNTADCPTKLLCYYGIHQILCGQLDEGMSFLKSSVGRLSSSCDETVLKLLAYQVLANCHRRKQEDEMASHFENLYRREFTTTSTYEEDEVFRMFVDDGICMMVKTMLVALLNGEEIDPVTDGMCNSNSCRIGRMQSISLKGPGNL